jgi:glycosyltransferase involved in cell wall biosynthesis
MNEEIKITVIVPTFNRAKILSACLSSLVNQEYSKDNYEILIVDNGSIDNTKDLVDQYIKKYSCLDMRYLYEQQAGLVFARHTGANNAKYEILSFTDDDGILSPCWLKEIANVFRMNPEIAAVAGKIDIKWDENPPDWVIPYESLLGKLDYGKEILIKKRLYINGGNFSIKKKILFEVGGFNPDQIGEWLIGDGESGLCRKLHERGYLIGWVPKALMEHCQIVKRNATFDDIKRRYINNGRGIPYRIFVVEGGGLKELLENLLVSGENYQLWKDKLQNSRSDEEKYKALFEMEYYSCQIPYTCQILTDKRLREIIVKNNISNSAINQFFHLSIEEQYRQLFSEYVDLQRRYNILKKEYRDFTNDILPIKIVNVLIKVIIRIVRKLYRRK